MLAGWQIRLGVVIALAIAIFLSLNIASSSAQEFNLSKNLPASRPHPLPKSLDQIQTPPGSGNYFNQVQSSPLGYLAWSNFPVKVYVDYPTNGSDTSASHQRFVQWTQMVNQAIADWQGYLDLTVVKDAKEADISIYRRQPPLGTSRDPKTGQIQIPRARNAQTRYDFYQTEETPPRLRQRMTIEIKPGMGPPSVLSTARHELGHALGIWGHSPLETDALYFAQTAISPAISERDLNTLKKIYQQPTQLGWPLK